MSELWNLPIPLVGNRPPLNANKRLNPFAHNRRVQDIKDAIGWRVREVKIPSLEHVTVQLVYQPQNRRRRDPSNLMPTQKAAVDGLVLAGVVPDDTPEFVTEEIPAVLDPNCGKSGLWLVVESTPLLSPLVRREIDEDSRQERTQDARDRYEETS